MQIWTPNDANYEVGSREIELLDSHARMYDSLLSVGKNYLTGDVCIFREGKPLFGWQRIPSIEELQERLYKTDTFRHGEEIFDKALKEAEQVKKEGRKDYEETLDEVTERIEFELRPR